MRKLPLILMVFVLFLLPSALAQLSCSITTTAACAGVPILKLSAATDAHASTPVPTNVASHVICCNGVADLTVNYISIPNQYVTSLASTSDSHVSILVGPGAYANKLSIDSTNYAINCGGPLLPADCSTYQTCLYEVPNGGSDEHVFPCSSSELATRRQVCCSATLGGGGGEAAPFCNDGDGGAIYSVLGTTSDYFGASTDSCSGSQLTEWICNQATLTRVSLTYNCPNGCLNGACAAAAVPCDETDNGRDYTRAAETTDATGSSDDFCTGNVLTEYWCDGNTKRSEQYTCNQCIDGACAAASCTDSDGGAVYAVQGTVTPSTGVPVTDSCGAAPDNNILTEWTCINDVASLQTYDCTGTGATCVNGACTGGCTDWDGGLVYEIGSYVSVAGVGNVFDNCLDGPGGSDVPASDLVSEITCNGMTFATTEYTCPGDSTCLQNAQGRGYCGCVDADGNDYTVTGTAYDAYAQFTDDCQGLQVREFTCDSTTNRAVGTNADCPAGTNCENGACVGAQVTGFPCVFTETFWTDGFEHELTQAAVNLPVYAIITGTNCADTTADFVITTTADLSTPVATIANMWYVPEGGIWYALAEWTFDTPGTYTFSVTSTNGADSEVRSDGNLEVIGSCPDAVNPPGPCPAGWTGGENDDADCDGVRDCFDYCIGTFGGQIDPNSGCSSGVPSCETEAWDCSGTTFGECGPDPADSNNYLQTREGNCARDLVAYPDYCPPPISERGCVIPENFPIFGWMNLLAVSLMLIGFYAFKNSKFK